MNEERVEKLRRRVDANREWRERDVLKDKEKNDRLKVIREAYNTTRLGFWCRKCSADFEGVAYKEVRYPTYFNNNEPIAWYVSHCPKGHEAIRHITDKLKDSYYNLSVMIQRQRVDMADAMLTPDNPRFKAVYPTQWRKLEEQRIDNEEREAMELSVLKRQF